MVIEFTMVRTNWHVDWNVKTLLHKSLLMLHKQCNKCFNLCSGLLVDDILLVFKYHMYFDCNRTITAETLSPRRTMAFATSKRSPVQTRPACSWVLISYTIARTTSSTCLNPNSTWGTAQTISSPVIPAFIWAMTVTIIKGWITVAERTFRFFEQPHKPNEYNQNSRYYFHRIFTNTNPCIGNVTHKTYMKTICKVPSV